MEGVVKGSPAEKAGILEGDIILEMAGFPVDARGNYNHPLYGKISLSHLIRCESHAGDSMRLKILRKGTVKVVDMVLEHRASRDYLIPPYLIDTAPRYYILGGLVLQELSFPYLAEYGKRWQSQAPIDFVYYEQYQNSLDVGNRKKIVFVSAVLPTSYTMGYEDLSNLVVTRINNQVIGKLEDVPKAIKTPVNGFHKIEFKEHPNFIFLDPLEIPKINHQIQQR